MKLVPTPLPGVWLIETEVIEDARGGYRPLFSRATLAEQGIEFELGESGVATNRKAGTVRGMHFQRAPHAQAKLVRVSRGAIFDVAVCLETGAWCGRELSATNGRLMYIPATGYGHGYQTLVDDTEVVYMMSGAHDALAASGLRWDDPALGIDWPLREGCTVNARDAVWPDF